MPGSLPGMMTLRPLRAAPPSHNFDAARLMLILFGRFIPFRSVT
jgi:hypothetical protein